MLMEHHTFDKKAPALGKPGLERNFTLLMWVLFGVVILGKAKRCIG